jgi:hypothetical protein
MAATTEGRMVTRQREYQKRHVAAGLCMKCMTPMIPGVGRCIRHYLFDRLRERGLTKGVLSTLKKAKRERLAATLIGRYTAIAEGFLQPGSKDQTVQDAVDIRLRLRIHWGGVRGAAKLAAIIQAIDRSAMRVRRERGGVTDVVVRDGQK